MRWKAMDGDLPQAALASALRGAGWRNAVHAVANRAAGVRIYCAQDAHKTMLRHGLSDRREVGGLLVGCVALTEDAAAPLVVVTRAVPGDERRNSAVFVELGSAVWRQADAAMQAGECVVGWYHTHPNLGAFFSGTDRRTQAAFFPHPYSLGWVIDPYRGEQKLYIGAASIPYRHEPLPVDCRLAMMLVRAAAA